MGVGNSSLVRPVHGALTQAGNIVELFVDVVRNTFRRPFQFREFIEQAWFIASVTILPTALVAIPFGGAVVSLQTGSLIKQLGAESFTGAASVLAVIQQGSPIVTALLIAGAAGSAVTADLGSRTIREEIDAMRVLGIDPVQRLVVPRVLAMILVAVLLNGLVSVVGIAGGYFFNVILQGGTPGATWPRSRLSPSCRTCTSRNSRRRFSVSSPESSPPTRVCTPRPPRTEGGREAVNQTVVITFLLLFFANLILTMVYLQIVPAKGS